MSEWVVYVMVAEAGETLRHFKVGISSSVDRRLPSVQTGCPVPITSVMCLRVPGEYTARGIESVMHWQLRGYRSSGEWFRFDLADPEHKAAFNGAARLAIQQYIGNDTAAPKWEVFNVGAERRRAAQVNAERRDARKRAHRLGIARMATHGHRYIA